MACSMRTTVKYLLFTFNFIFWLIGAALVCVGGWAYYEKNRYYNSSAQSIYDIIFDVSIVFIVIGFIIFAITFAGCLGALRENRCLLKTFTYCLGIVFLLEVTCALLAFIFSAEVQAKVTSVIQEEGLVRYRDDDDLQSLMDWIQETFGCCGVGPHGYKDWSLNIYFNCSEDNPSVERCAVPFSCCLEQNNLDDNIINTACGYGVQLMSIFEAADQVYVDGCVDQVLQDIQSNLVIVGGVGIGVALMQIMGIFLSRVFADRIADDRVISQYQYHRGKRY